MATASPQLSINAGTSGASGMGNRRRLRVCRSAFTLKSPIDAISCVLLVRGPTRSLNLPVEAVAILGKEITSVEMPPGEYEKAPTWMGGNDGPLPKSEIIHIALTRR
jgi:hypothetical protein